MDVERESLKWVKGEMKVKQPLYRVVFSAKWVGWGCTAVNSSLRPYTPLEGCLAQMLCYDLENSFLDPNLYCTELQIFS